MIRFFQTKTRGAFNRLAQTTRQTQGSGNTPKPEGVPKKTGGFFKSGLIILGGIYGYHYFTGDLEDINLYHVSLFPTFYLTCVVH